jgi:hypothetical protein
MRAAPSSSSSSPSPIAPSPSDQSKRPDPKSTTQLRPAGIMAALLGRPEAQPGTDPRAAVVRLDTVEDEPAGYARRLKTPPQGQPVAGPLPHEEAAVTGSFRPPLRAAQLDVPGGGDDDEHTNPGVKLSDLRKKARDVE